MGISGWQGHSADLSNSLFVIKTRERHLRQALVQSLAERGFSVLKRLFSGASIASRVCCLQAGLPCPQSAGTEHKCGVPRPWEILNLTKKMI